MTDLLHALGEKGEYFVVGEGPAVLTTIEEEIRVSDPSKFYVGSKNISAENLLDITQPDDAQILTSAGVDARALDSYTFTQALGNAARANGFDGIIFESAKVKGAKNIVLFK